MGRRTLKEITRMEKKMVYGKIGIKMECRVLKKFTRMDSKRKQYS